MNYSDLCGVRQGFLGSMASIILSLTTGAGRPSLSFLTLGVARLFNTK
jgi:hypothetical protein